MMLWLEAFCRLGVATWMTRLSTVMVYCTISNTNIKYNSKLCPHVAEGPSLSGALSHAV